MLYGNARLCTPESPNMVLKPAVYHDINPVLKTLYNSNFEFTLTGSRALGFPKIDSDWDFVAHTNTLSSTWWDLLRLLESLQDSIPDAVVTRTSSYDGTIEGGADHNLEFLFRIEVPGYNSVDIQFVRDSYIRRLQIEFFRKHRMDWSTLKKAKTANVMWNLAENLVKDSTKGRRYLWWKATKARYHDIFEMNGIAITYREFSEGRKKILAGETRIDPLEWNWTKDLKFKQHTDTRVTWRLAYWWLNTFYSKWMEKA